MSLTLTDYQHHLILSLQKGAFLETRDFLDEVDQTCGGHISFIHFDPEPREPTQEEIANFWVASDAQRSKKLEHLCQLSQLQKDVSSLDMICEAVFS